MAQFDAKKFTEMQKETGAGSGKKDNKKEKKEKPAQQPKQKKEKTPDAEEDEPLVPKEPKKDPMEAVPKGNFYFTNLAQIFMD